MIMRNNSPENPLSPEERQELRRRLWKLMAVQTALYTAFDSTSVSSETARELFTSVCFTLQGLLDAQGLPQTELLRRDMKELLEAGRSLIDGKVARGKYLWLRACNSAPRLQSVAYKETLTELGAFFSRYDRRFFAHRIPCDIDYQLCTPVDEKLAGIDYVNCYLENLITENELISAFPQTGAEALARKYCGSWRTTVLNLCEPLLVNALALCLCGEDPKKLSVGSSEKIHIMEMLEPMPEEMGRSRLREAGESLKDSLSRTDEHGGKIIMSTSLCLYPRLHAAVDKGCLDELFFSL